jgi:hypothetical protein
MVIVHETGVERQLPLATKPQMFIVVFNGVFGTLLGDFMWLYATLLTSSLISTLSMTLSIPLSMAADAFFRNQPPDTAQIIAAIPILVFTYNISKKFNFLCISKVSFIGASFLTSTYHSHGNNPPEPLDDDQKGSLSLQNKRKPTHQSRTIKTGKDGVAFKAAQKTALSPESDSLLVEKGNYV